MSLSSIVKTAQISASKVLQATNKTLVDQQRQTTITNQTDISNITQKVISTQQNKIVTIIEAINNITSTKPVTTSRVSNIWLEKSPSISLTKPVINNQQISKPSTFIESQIGISSKRPEIIGIFDFLPLYDKDENLTPEGKFLNAKLNLEFLQQVEWQQTCDLSSLQTTNTQELQELLITQRNKNIVDINTASNIITYFCDLMKLIKFSKESLNLRTFKHNISYNSFLSLQFYSSNRILLNNTTVQTTDINNFLKQNISSQTTDLKSILSTYFKFKPDKIEKFSSTKIWQQSSLELKNLLLSWSLYSCDKNVNDNNVFDLSLNSNKNITYGYKSVISQGLPTIRHLSQMMPHEVKNTCDQLAYTYKKFSVNSNDYANKLSIILWIFSKEIRFSNGLSKSEVIQALSQHFNYSINVNENSQVIDAIFGQYALNVNTMLDTSNNLRNISYEINQTTNESILNFESNYYTSGGEITPGPEYYFNDILKNFDQKQQISLPKINKFITRLNSICDGCNIVANGMNWLVEDRIDIPISISELKVTIPERLYNLIKNKFIDEKTNNFKNEYTTDVVMAICDYASQKVEIKILLFSLVILQLYRNSHIVGTNLSDYASQKKLIELLRNNITNNLKKNVINAQAYVIRRSISSIIKSYNGVTDNMFDELLLSNKSPIWNSIQDLMQVIYVAVYKTDILKSDKTKFSGILDTTMFLSIFDAILLLISSYSNNKLDSVNEYNQYSSKTQSYVPYENLLIIKNKQVDQKILNYNHQRVILRLNKEKTAIIDSYIAILGTLNSIRNTLQSIKSYLVSNKTIENINALRTLVPNLSNDYINLLLNEQQMMLSQTTISDLQINITKNNITSTNILNVLRNKNYNDILDELKITNKTKNLLISAFKQENYKDIAGFNKKIISVGLPIGFVESFQQMSTSIQNINRKQQQDIITLNVYKVDEQYPDIIWKPIKFLFELSRFIVKVDSKHSFSKKDTYTSFDKLKNVIATRDLTQENYNESNILFYGANITGVRKAFSTEDYSFLSKDEKQQLITNHVMSYIIELYVKSFTGLRLCETTFNLLESDTQQISQNLATSLIRHRLQLLFAMRQTSEEDANLFVDSIFKMVNNSHLNGDNISSNITDLLNGISQQDILSVINEIRAINAFCNTPSAFTNISSILQKVLVPKQFDRVLNIIIDPDDFQIDMYETIKNPEGKKALDNLVTQGQITLQTINGINYYNNIMTAKTPGNVSFDKYYVTVQTVGELNV